MCISPIMVHGLRKDGTTYGATVPCGKCVECSKAVSTEWAFRICQEASLYDYNCCLTLTYDNEHLPDGEVLVRRDIQLFLKSLRKHVSPRKIRVFYSGEYGSLRGRPHFHCIVFNYMPPDLVEFSHRKGRTFYTSKTISDLWKRGNILVGEVDFHTAFYTAKYLQKCIDFGKPVKPFVGMSTRPGIGYAFATPKCLETDKIYVDGKTHKIPRYYLKVLKREGYSTLEVELWREMRMLMAQDNADIDCILAREKRVHEFLAKK